MAIIDELIDLKSATLNSIAQAADTSELEAVRVGVLGKKGTLTGYLRGMGQLAPEERATVGKTANEVRNAVEAALEARKAELSRAELLAKMDAEAVDITLPGRVQQMGTRHLISGIIDEIS
ncbi:MAG: phenylalanine--tRNA ligase subunit alpha, partial [Slackia sp.]|nr:phenylalanine--tRNA ligase subunit alpha [Slackia sp.]